MGIRCTELLCRLGKRRFREKVTFISRATTVHEWPVPIPGRSPPLRHAELHPRCGGNNDPPLDGGGGPDRSRRGPGVPTPWGEAGGVIRLRGRATSPARTRQLTSQARLPERIRLWDGTASPPLRPPASPRSPSPAPSSAAAASHWPHRPRPLPTPNGMSSPAANPVATGRSTPATATTAGCSSPPAPGWATAVGSSPRPPTWLPGKSRSRSPRRSSRARARARGRPVVAGSPAPPRVSSFLSPNRPLRRRIRSMPRRNLRPPTSQHLPPPLS